MTKKLSIPLVLYLAVTSTRAAGPTIAIDAASPAGNVSRLFYGLMTEEINHAYDGGLYAELVQNRAFLDDAAAPAHWAVVQGEGAAAAIALDKSQPLNDTIPRASGSTSRRHRRRTRREWRTTATGAFL
jgi:alpha-L-arabinofuranosidase